MANASLVGRPLTPRIGLLTDISYRYYVSDPNIISAGVDAIAGEVYNVLSTRIGDEPWEPRYGSDLPLYAFAPFTEDTEQVIFTDVFLALRDGVPQIQMDLARSQLYVDRQRRIVGLMIAITGEGFSAEIPIDLTGVY